MPNRWTTRSEPYGHDPIEVEHRLTALHGDVKGLHGDVQSLREESDERHGSMSRRMSLVEKAIVGILVVLQVLLQDKWPALAALLKELRP